MARSALAATILAGAGSIFIGEARADEQLFGRVKGAETLPDGHAEKSRDADHLQNFVHDALAGIDADKLAADLLKAGKEKIRDYAFDCHTLKGKRAGKTKADFFREEQRALKPFQPGLFDALREG